jgi:hypothetical protein
MVKLQAKIMPFQPVGVGMMHEFKQIIITAVMKIKLPIQPV